MSWTHTWSGLLLGWLLYFIFVTGTAGYLDTEIDRWMRPEMPPASPPVPLERSASLGLAVLEERAPGARRWIINPPLGREQPWLAARWQGAPGPGEKTGTVELDAVGGAVLSSRETAGGQTLYRMHWVLHYMPRSVAEWIVGVATLFMLVALVTGIVVHKKIFADFFTFRPGKGQRSWLDAHNLASVVTLPFQLMITYSGLVFMMFVYMPLIAAAHYGLDEAGRNAFRDEVFGSADRFQPTGQPSPLVPIGAVLEQTRSLWGEVPVRRIDVFHPGDAGAHILVTGDRAASPVRSAAVLVFDGVSGELLLERPAVESSAKAVRDLLLGLHEGLFAGPLLRALYVLSGLLGTAMIATGLVLWTVKRRQRTEKASEAPHPGLRLAERLNVATVVGLPVAIAAYFWANRLLPVDMAGRADWEVHVMFLAWGAMFAHAALRPVARAWYEQWIIAAAAFGLLPLLNALTTDRHLGVSVTQGDWVIAGFDLTMLAVAGGCLLAARYLGIRARGASTGTLFRPSRIARGGAE